MNYELTRKMNKITKTIIIITFLLSISLKIFAATNYVSKTGGHVFPFISWADAATNIQAAVDAAGAGDMVLVDDGTYYLSSQISVTNDMIVKSVSGAEKTIVNGGFPAQTNMCFYINTNDVIDGFTITNGFAGRGGGVYCDYGGTIINCLILGNKAEYAGGGVRCLYGGIVSNCTIGGNVCSDGGGISGAYGGTILNSIIENNLANGWSGDGGGVDFYHDGILKNCIIRGNTTLDGDGGGVACNYKSIVENCVIVGNTANEDGGGVLCKFEAIVKDCVITNNTAKNAGGARCGTRGDVENCIIVGNNAQEEGGGVYCYGELRNCLIINNSSGTGGGVFSWDGTIQNCTISGNSASNTDGGVTCNGYTIIQNSIIWNNTNDNTFSSTTTNIYNCIENWTNIVNGIITNNPKFRDVAAGNYRLEEFSPCRNTGTNMSWMLTAKDLDGNPRITGGIVDMGGYEYIPEPFYLLFIIYYLIFISWWRMEI